LNSNELAAYLALKTFGCFEAYAIYIMKLNNEYCLEEVESFGLTNEQKAGWKKVPLSHEVPSSDAVREDRLIWISSKEDWEAFYPQLINYPGSDKLKTLINTPLHLTNSPIGVLGIMCSEENVATPEEIAFLDIVAGLVSLHLSRIHSSRVQTEDIVAYLTKRQLSILEYMSEQMTNIQIARELGYSESTIRHETMRIYQLLSATGRRDSVVIARKLGLIQ
jgi:DNA-binding CsgD family transcriptional regulator